MASIISQETAIYSHQSSQFNLFKSLPDLCSPVIEKQVQRILKSIDDRYVGAITVSGWCGVVAMERIVKYAAKRAMESKYFDVLIWVTLYKKGSTLNQFQQQIAKRLGIAFPTNDDSDDEKAGKETDDAVAGQISKFLKDKVFLLVHNGPWNLQELRAIGLPNIGNVTQSKVLVATSSWGRPYHEAVSFQPDLPLDEFGDIFKEESVDVSEALSLRGALVSSKSVMDCILYLCVYARGETFLSNTRILLRHLVGEGFVEDANMDLVATFNLGMHLLQELDNRCIIHLNGEFWKCNQEVLKGVQQQEGMEASKMDYEGAYREGDAKSLCNLYRILDAYQRMMVDRFSLINYIAFGFSDFFKISNTRLSMTEFSKRYKEMPENIFENMTEIKILVIEDSSMTSLPSSIGCLHKLKLLSLRCRSLETIFLQPFHKLLVLDLSYNSIENLPDNSFEYMQSLRLLVLSECKRILSLPSSVSCLENLEMLLLDGCRQLCVLPSTTLPLKKLQVLNLSETNLNEIPKNFFANCIKLEELNLSFNKHLIHLPASISSLVSLKTLNLESCTSLKTLVPSLVQFPSSIEVLNLSKCTSLEDITQFPPFPMKNLQVINLSYTPVKSLILKPCSSLKNLTLQSNNQLEVLNLSGTKIREFPFESCFEDRRFCSRLDLLFMGVNWLPQKVKLTHCGQDVMSHGHIPMDEWRKVGNGGGAFISVENSNIFKSLTASSQLWRAFSSRFLIFVGDSVEHGMERTQTLQSEGFRYKDVYSKLKTKVPLYDRCLEIGGVEKFPKGLAGVLSQTEFLYIHDERTVVKLSDMGCKDMGDLRECWLERCQAMKVVFDDNALDKHQTMLRCLEKLRISKLMKLQNVCVTKGIIGKKSFGQLKHFHMVYCPNVVNIFTSVVGLENLEVLEIKFCARLEGVFEGEFNDKGALWKLQKLVLFELPNLKSIARKVELVSLKNVQVRGCRQLRKLPIVNDASVTVTGESKWWQRLEWEDGKMESKIHFKGWKPYTTLKRKVEVILMYHDSQCLHPGNLYSKKGTNKNQYNKVLVFMQEGCELQNQSSNAVLERVKNGVITYKV